jgi:hypothetical protein
VLHPWAYDLDQVDFKYIINNNINEKILENFTSLEARVFWLSYFKSSASVSADDFFQAIRECWETSKSHDGYNSLLPVYKQAAAQNDYVFSITANASLITEFVSQVGSDNGVFNTILSQIKTYSGHYEGTTQIKSIDGFKLESDPKLSVFAKDKYLSQL